MRARLRALAITVLLVISGVQNIPNTAVAEGDLNNPVAKTELKRWQELLASVGVERTVPQLKEDALGWGNGINEAKKSFMKPFRPVYRVTGTGQAWGLFTYPNTHPHQLIIEVREGGEWRPVFRAMESEYAWKDETFRFRRVRGVYDDNAWKQRQSYKNFVNWAARMAWEDFPDADAIKVYMIRRNAREPGRPHDPTPEFRMKRVVEKP